MSQLTPERKTELLKAVEIAQGVIETSDPFAIIAATRIGLDAIPELLASIDEMEGENAALKKREQHYRTIIEQRGIQRDLALDEVRAADARVEKAEANVKRLTILLCERGGDPSYPTHKELTDKIGGLKPGGSALTFELGTGREIKPAPATRKDGE